MAESELSPSDPDYRSNLLKEFKFEEEERELIIGYYGKTGFPKPIKFYKLMWEVYDLSLEEPYYWVLDTLKAAFPEIIKVEDSFAASENSAFFGVTQQRLGAQQDKVSQFLATAGKMIKELFQMVRELRIIDERMEYYEEVKKQFPKPVEQRSKSAEITLKGMFVDLVQGGGKSAASVYGMARELEFITLPDLFFDAPPFQNYEELDAHVNGLEKNFNKNVIRVLQRHLRQFMEWRKRTHQEHINRRRFQLSYLNQHFDIIKMYVNWVKPYLRHVARMHMKEKNLSSADIVMAFESSMLDVEFIARKRIVVGSESTNACILTSFNYRTRPELKVIQEGYQKGPVHIGKMEYNLRLYNWSDEQVESYIKMKDKEALWLMGEVSSSVQEAMNSLGDELDKYLGEAKRKAKGEEEPEEAPKKKSFMEIFFGDFYTPPKDKKKIEQKKSKLSRDDLIKFEDEKSEAMKGASVTCWTTFHNFKKAHKMIAW